MASGNTRQKEAYRILKKLNVFTCLKSYHPILVGTIPIHVDVDGSDLDIICEVNQVDVFQAEVEQTFGSFDDFSCFVTEFQGLKQITIAFTYQGWPIELFGQSVPTKEQNGYKHMLIESRILEHVGESGRNSSLSGRSRG